MRMLRIAILIVVGMIASSDSTDSTSLECYEGGYFYPLSDRFTPFTGGAEVVNCTENERCTMIRYVIEFLGELIYAEAGGCSNLTDNSTCDEFVTVLELENCTLEICDEPLCVLFNVDMVPDNGTTTLQPISTTATTTASTQFTGNSTDSTPLQCFFGSVLYSISDRFTLIGGGIDVVTCERNERCAMARYVFVFQLMLSYAEAGGCSDLPDNSACEDFLGLDILDPQNCTLEFCDEPRCVLFNADMVPDNGSTPIECYSGTYVYSLSDRFSPIGGGADIVNCERNESCVMARYVTEFSGGLFYAEAGGCSNLTDNSTCDEFVTVLEFENCTLEICDEPLCVQFNVDMVPDNDSTSLQCYFGTTLYSLSDRFTPIGGGVVVITCERNERCVLARYVTELQLGLVYAESGGCFAFPGNSTKCEDVLGLVEFEDCTLEVCDEPLCVMFNVDMVPVDGLDCNDTSARIRLLDSELEALDVDVNDQFVISSQRVSNTSSVDSKCIRSFNETEFTLELTDCNPVITVNESSTVVIWNVRKLEVEGAFVIRKDDCLQRTCVYNSKQLLTSSQINPLLRKNILASEQENVTYVLGLDIYKDEDKLMPLDSDDVITVPELLYVKVELVIDSENTNLIVQMETCWATPSADPDDSTQYFFINAGCANSSDLDSDSNPVTVVTRNYQLTTGCFRFRSFVWKDDMGDPIFVHCQVTICNNETEGSDCSGPTCMNKRDVRRRGIDSGSLYSYGPIRVYSDARPSCLKNNGGCSDICSILSGTVVCSCTEGKMLMNDQRTCQEAMSNTMKFMEYESIFLIPAFFLIGVAVLLVMSYRRVTNPLSSNQIASKQIA